MLNKISRYILFCVFLILSGLTLIFMYWNYVFDIYTVVSFPQVGAVLVLERLKIMGAVVCTFLFFWYLAIRLVNKTKK